MSEDSTVPIVLIIVGSFVGTILFVALILLIIWCCGKCSREEKDKHCTQPVGNVYYGTPNDGSSKQVAAPVAITKKSIMQDDTFKTILMIAGSFVGSLLFVFIIVEINYIYSKCSKKAKNKHCTKPVEDVHVGTPNNGPPGQVFVVAV